MITFWLFILLLQGGDVVAFAYPSQEECVEQRAVAATIPDVLAHSECFQTSVTRNQASKVGL